MRAEIRAGQLLREMANTGSRAVSGDKESGRSKKPLSKPTLSDLGVTKDQSSRLSSARRPRAARPQPRGFAPANRQKRMGARPCPRQSTFGNVSFDLGAVKSGIGNRVSRGA